MGHVQYSTNHSSLIVRNYFLRTHPRTLAKSPQELVCKSILPNNQWGYYLNIECGFYGYCGFSDHKTAKTAITALTFQRFCRISFSLFPLVVFF